MADDAPPGVDPGLWAEFQQISEEVHRLLRERSDNDDTGPAMRLVIDVPHEWILLAAWIAARTKGRAHGKDGPTMIGPHDLANERLMRHLAKPHIAWALNEHFHSELHWLCTGRSDLLRPKQEKAEVTEARPSVDLDDDIPF